MKKTLNFSKGFVPSVIISCVLVVFGLVGFFTKGINFGIDFKPGLVEEVRVASPAASLSYNGPAKVAVLSSALLGTVSGSSVSNKVG